MPKHSYKSNAFFLLFFKKPSIFKERRDDMLGYQYHRVLKEIATQTFPENRILTFKVEIHPKEMKSRHGDYDSSKRVIRVFNLSQRVDYTISTALHELAHHCEFSLYGNTGHSKQFYSVFKSLLETAVAFGIVDYEIIRTQDNANDINMLEKHFGPVDTEATHVTPIDETVIKVFNSFSIRHLLKERGYFFDQVEKAWGKIIPTTDAKEEESFLLNHVTEIDIVKRPLFDLTFEAIYYIFVKGGYDMRTELQQNGYFFKQLKKTKGWAKKIVATDLKKEEQILKELTINSYKVTSSLI